MGILMLVIPIAITVAGIMALDDSDGGNGSSSEEYYFEGDKTFLI